MTPLDFRLAAAFARSLVSYRFGGPARPFSASVAVTNRCNLRCRYCNTPYLTPEHMNLRELELLFGKLKRMGICRLGIAGGEPLVRADIGEVIALAVRHGFWVSINTNLNLYDRHVTDFEHVALVFTSLDGSAEHHREGRGANSLDGTLEAIRDLRRRQIAVVGICVVDEHNLADVDYLLELAESLDIRIHFQSRCVDTAIVRGNYSPDLNQPALREFWSRLRRMTANRRIASTPLYLEHLTEWPDHRQSAMAVPGQRCAAGYGFLYVDPNGDAYPCAFTKGKAAPVNLLREDWPATPPETPCTDCSVGPMAEFNLLFRKPFTAAVSAARSYSGST